MSRRKIPNLIARKNKQLIRKLTRLTNKEWCEWCERRAEGKRWMLKIFSEFFAEAIETEKKNEQQTGQ